ncbi:MAG: YqhA family protein [Rhodospirillaceae bacterium]
MNLRDIERRIVVSTRFFTIIAVVGSLAGSLLMLFLGSVNVYEAFRHVLEYDAESEDMFGATTIIAVIESLDRFLIALVMLYFAYGVYSLFVHPEESEQDLSLPFWLRVRRIGQLKQVVAELIVVILFVLFLRQCLQAFSVPGTVLTWNGIFTLLVLPVSAVFLALALKLIELHPKERVAPPQSDNGSGNGK